MKSLLHVATVYSIIAFLLFLNLFFYRQFENRKSSFTDKVESIKAQTVGIRTKIDNESKIIAEMDRENIRIQDENKELSGKLEELQDSLLTEDRFPVLLNSLQKMCNSSSIEVLSLEQTAVNEAGDGKFSRSHFKLSVKSEYRNLISLLGYTESLPYLLVIRGFSITGIDPEDGRLNVLITLMVFLKEVPA
ncbi:MAG: type 4a pilus biogenesis protein PilO [Candidatus Wallbacteria bacterium]|nr:type 4a pilus biogenesis protein PilO [Candidatus Wallbacteria bacterium]